MKRPIVCKFTALVFGFCFAYGNAFMVCLFPKDQKFNLYERYRIPFYILT